MHTTNKQTKYSRNLASNLAKLVEIISCSRIIFLLYSRLLKSPQPRIDAYFDVFVHTYLSGDDQQCERDN
jgi:hypothetical protein